MIKKEMSHVGRCGSRVGEEVVWEYNIPETRSTWVTDLEKEVELTDWGNEGSQKNL